MLSFLKHSWLFARLFSFCERLCQKLCKGSKLSLAVIYVEPHLTGKVFILFIYFYYFYFFASGFLLCLLDRSLGDKEDSKGTV